MTAQIDPVANSSPRVLPAAKTLRDVINALPKECFQKNPRKAWTSVAISVSAAILGYGLIAISPWYLLPIAWFFTGTVLTGWFVIGHDCGHRSFAQRRWVNDWVGHVMMLPLIYPFHCWRILHDYHHLHTNKMDVDNAWCPWKPEVYTTLNPILKGFYWIMRGSCWWIGSIAHWAVLHFNLSNFHPRDRRKAATSMLVVIGFAAIAFPTLIATTGVWGFVKFWLMPWLGYHFWMSTFTLVHHTLPDIQFRPVPEWNEVEGQLDGTVHCDYPRWVEILCHDINVHIPHHVSVAIPSYNLRLAHATLKQNWGDRLHEERFSLALMNRIVGQNGCHLYHPDEAYLSFRQCQQRKDG